nr:unnamed protein product [Callosobruchus analis]
MNATLLVFQVEYKGNEWGALKNVSTVYGNSLAEVEMEVDFGRRLNSVKTHTEQLSSQLEEVDIRSNGWSDWSAWSPCSRSCDGGASRQVRTCNGGKCRGEYVQYRICNMQVSDIFTQECILFTISEGVPFVSVTK